MSTRPGFISYKPIDGGPNLTVRPDIIDRVASKDGLAVMVLSDGYHIATAEKPSAIQERIRAVGHGTASPLKAPVEPHIRHEAYSRKIVALTGKTLEVASNDFMTGAWLALEGQPADPSSKSLAVVAEGTGGKANHYVQYRDGTNMGLPRLVIAVNDDDGTVSLQAVVEGESRPTRGVLTVVGIDDILTMIAQYWRRTHPTPQ